MDTKNKIQMIHIIQMFSKTLRVPCAHIRGTRGILKKQVYICITAERAFLRNEYDSVDGNEKDCVANYSPAGQMGQMGQRFSLTPRVPRARGTRRIFKNYCLICPICP